MRSHAPIFAVLAFSGCSRSTDPTREGTAHASTVTGAEPAASEAPAPLRPGATCRFPARLDRDVTIARGCVADVRESVVVEAGRALVLEPGVTLRFARGTFLEFGHRGSRLVARGTAEAKVTFTSDAASPRAGDWVGLVIGDAIDAEGASLEHAVIEYAGSPAHDGRGSITAYAPFPAGRVSLRSVTVRSGAQHAIWAPFAGASFGAFERVALVDHEHGLRIGAQAFASLGEGNQLEADVELVGGVVSRSGRFRATRRPVVVQGPIAIEAGANEAAAVLEIEPGTTLRFAPGAWLSVGERGPGALLAEQVVLTSAAARPAPGDWVGVVIGEHVRRTRLASSTIEYAGGDAHGGDGAITFVGARSWLGLDVSLFSLTFRRIRNAHVSSNGEGCDRALDPRSGFSWDYGVEFCR